MTTADLWELLHGDGAYFRVTQSEPNELPHLARIVHPWGVPSLFQAARRWALEGSPALPWFALWEATLDAYLLDPPAPIPPESGLTAAEIAFRAAGRGAMNEATALQLLDQIDTVGGDRHLVARVVVLLPRERVGGLVAALDPSRMPAESARALLAGMAHHQLDVEASWLEALIDGDGTGEPSFSRRAHLVPFVPGERRDAIVRELLNDPIIDEQPPWFVALVASRIGWTAPEAMRVPALPAPWRSLVGALLAGPPDLEPHADVLRAHPFARELAAIDGRHEVSDGIVQDQLARDVLEAARVVEASPEALPEPQPDLSEGAESLDLGAESLEAGAEMAPTPSEVERRLQADVFVGDVSHRNAFIAGATHTVEISVGHGAAIVARAGFPEPSMPDDTDRVALLVRFLAGGAVQEHAIKLPRDRSRTSDVAAFTLDVAADAENVTAMVAVFLADSPNQLLQAAVLRGPVVEGAAEEAAATTQIELAVEAWVADLFTALPSSADASIAALSDGHTMATSSGASVSFDRSTVAATVDLLAQRIHAAAELLTESDEAFVALLRDLAKHGRSINAAIGLGLPDSFRAASHIQVIAANPSDLLPLELIYDGPQPTSQSPLCATWKEALAAGSCAGCAGGGPEADAASNDPRVCPLRFWSLSKVIERHARLTTEGGRFDVRAERVEGRESLGVLLGALVGASTKVADEGVRSAVKTARKHFRSAARAKEWDEWRKKVGDRGGEVLVAMPMHTLDEDVDPPLSALELGGLLRPSGAFDALDVGKGRDGIGPVVLLIGCHTGASKAAIDSFAGEFRENGASVVISTVGLILADHAAPAVELLLANLAAQQKLPGGTIGSALLATRRALLAEQKVLGLLIVAHGDADWKIGGS